MSANSHFVLFCSLILLALKTAAQGPYDGYQKMQLRIERQKGKAAIEQPLLANRVGQIWVRVRCNQPDSVSLFADSHRLKAWRISTTEDGAGYAANSIELALTGRRQLLIVDHDNEQYARFPITDRFRIVSVYLTHSTWWVRKTNLVTVIE